VGESLDGPRGRYRLLAEHGRGGFSVAYRGVRERDGAQVIVKVLRLDRLPRWKALELFEREASVLRGLMHPRIPRFIDEVSMAEPAGFALVMELMAGRTLREISRAEGLGPVEMRRWLREILEVLAFIHARAPPVIHRDVNPKNIILRPDGQAALVDFGSVQAALRAGDDLSTTAAGTFGYAPQEQFLGHATPASDLYGLGMTYLAVASGREPEQLPMDGLRAGVRQLLSGDPRLIHLLERMTEPDPNRRLASAQEALRLLAPLERAGQAPAGMGESGEVDITGAGDAPLVRPAPAAAESRYLHQLAARLAGQGFAVQRGGEIGRTPLDFSAYEPAEGLTHPAMRLLVARAEGLEGALPDRPLAPVPCALFVHAAATLPGEPPVFWRTLLGQRTVVVPVVLAPARGVGPRTLGHLGATLREPEAIHVIPVIVDLAAGSAEVVTPGSLINHDPHQLVPAVRRLLAL
jgi:hypothetical protein